MSTKPATSPWLGAWVALAVTSACAPVDTDLNDESIDIDEVRVAASSYYRVRPDLRRCISPLCGGVWVRRVNFSRTRCLDGSYQSECYLAEADWSALRLGDRALPDFQALALSGRAVIKARLEARTYGSFGNLGRLVVTEGWQAATAADPTGSFYLAKDDGLRCVRAPCPVIHLARLNSTVEHRVATVDLRRIGGITPHDIDKGLDYLHHPPPGILVAGSVRGTEFVASQFYLRVSEGVSDDRYCNATADCAWSTYARPVSSRDECYCAGCWLGTPLNREVASSNQASWTRYCRNVPLRCPAIACRIPQVFSCQAHACVVGTGAP